MKESYHLIKYKFDMGIYSLEQMCEFVEKEWITENEFHFITAYNYKAIKIGSDFSLPLS